MKIAQSWKDVNIKQFIDLYDIAQDESIEAIDKSIRIFSILSGLTIDEVESMTLDAWVQAQKDISWVHDFPKPTNPKSFRLGGYLWVPRLDIRKITAGEYISVTELTKEKENIVINTPKLIALFLTPYKGWWIFKRKIDLTFEAKVEILNHANVQQIYPMTLFFCTLLIKLVEAIPDFLTSTMNQLKEKYERERSQEWEHGDGTTF
jgi:hypothetical protein